ncbi:MAG: 50S ribosomal protein L9 [Bacteroidota bacterium]|nr:50S ribosomal protein L9 [Bacteroidota bacterium]
MKVILRKDFDKLGKVGELVDVKDGFARNYLIPQEIAYVATEGGMRALEEEKKQHTYRQQKEERDAQKIASRLDNVSITIKAKVGEDEKLFGSVTPQMIADALQEQGFTIDKRIIELEEPIKALGIYTVPVKVHPSIIGKVKVWVVRE